MRRTTGWIILGVAAAIIVGGVGLLASFPSTDWRDFEDASAIEAKGSPNDIYPGLRIVGDRTSQALPGRNVVVEASCPAGPQAMDCAAGASRAAAIWFARHGADWAGESGKAGSVDWLLVNIDYPGLDTSSGPQLIGTVAPVLSLAEADTAGILERFSWNGAGALGEVAPAQWCSEQSGDPTFCKAFRADACQAAQDKRPEVARYCERATRT